MAPPIPMIDRRSTAKADAARTVFKAAELAVDETDHHCWRVAARWMFWPATGLWRRPNGLPGGGGASRLVAAIRAEKGDPAPQGPAE